MPAGAGPSRILSLGIMMMAAVAATGGGAQPAGDEAIASPEYARLLGALASYQGIVDSGGWPAVPAGPTIRPGADDPRVAVLTERLRATGDLRASGITFSTYDEALEIAVRHFQARHGLEPDALVGPATLRALNVPAHERVRQLDINLTRTREVFTPTRSDFLLVNVPAFEAYLYRSGALVWQAGVVVGETENETPLLESRVQSVVLNPTWAVPRSIASEELLPKIQADIGFLSRGGYDVFAADGQAVDPATIDWTSLNVNDFPYTLVQRPGSMNELGRIKFLFPNEFSICMHDTPSKYLFSHYSRAFSHGCIRIEEPVALAERLLADEGMTRAQIDARLATEETETVRLGEPLPIVLAYLTATVDAAGTVRFFRDIYGGDALDADESADQQNEE